MSYVLGFGVVLDIHDLLSRNEAITLVDLEKRTEEIGLTILTYKTLAFVAFEESLRFPVGKIHSSIDDFLKSYRPTKQDSRILSICTGKTARWFIFPI